jgi:hypothetical protein
MLEVEISSEISLRKYAMLEEAMDGKAGLTLRLIKCRVGSLMQGCADATMMAGI